MTAYPVRCAKSRQPCPTPYSCASNCGLNVSEGGRKVAHGKAIDYTGKEAEEPAIEMFEPWTAQLELLAGQLAPFAFVLACMVIAAAVFRHYF